MNRICHFLIKVDHLVIHSRMFVQSHVRHVLKVKFIFWKLLLNYVAPNPQNITKLKEKTLQQICVEMRFRKAFICRNHSQLFFRLMWYTSHLKISLFYSNKWVVTCHTRKLKGKVSFYEFQFERIALNRKFWSTNEWNINLHPFHHCTNFIQVANYSRLSRKLKNKFWQILGCRKIQNERGDWCSIC